VTKGASAAARPSRVAGITQREVDGVPVLTAKVDGPLRAALLFRVGQADEVLPRRGITHLVEHLALTNTDRGPHAFNGVTGDLVTSFVVAGEQAEVVTYLREVCLALQNLPVDRFEHERGILRAEAARPGGSFFKSLMSWRWGPAGYGLMGYDEVGLDDLQPDDVVRWATTRFTRSDAILWLSNAIPTELTLPLPDRPADIAALSSPTLDPVVSLPAAYTYSPRGIAFNYLAPRQAEGSALVWLMVKRLQAKLRDELGMSYGVQAGLERISTDTSMHTFFADCLPENAAAVQDGVVQVLRDIRGTKPKAQELRDMRGALRLAATDQAGKALGHLDYVARLMLLGGKPKTKAAIDRESQAVTAESLQAYAREALTNVLLAVPEVDKVPPTLAEKSPTWSRDAVTGDRYEPSELRQDKRITNLVVGPEGISLLAGYEAVTVRFAECAGMMRHEDGARTLIGRDGFHVAYRPEEWGRSKPVAARLDAAVPKDVWITGGKRDIPKPTSKRRRLALRFNIPRLMFVIAVLVISGAVTAINNHDSSSTPPAIPSNLGGSLNLGDSLAGVSEGDCFLENDQLAVGLFLSVGCTTDHNGEVIAILPDPHGGSQSQWNRTCTTAAQQRLAPQALVGIEIRGVETVTDTTHLTCIGVATGIELPDQPLQRKKG
jgi:zinc protease